MSSFFQTTFATPTTGANFIYLNASGQLYRYIQSSNSNTIIESNVDDIVSSTSDKKNVIFVSTDTVNANFKYLKEYNSTTQAVTELRHYNITSEYNKMYQVGAEPYYLSCTIGGDCRKKGTDGESIYGGTDYGVVFNTSDGSSVERVRTSSVGGFTDVIYQRGGANFYFKRLDGTSPEVYLGSNVPENPYDHSFVSLNFAFFQNDKTIWSQWGHCGSFDKMMFSANSAEMQRWSVTYGYCGGNAQGSWQFYGYTGVGGIALLHKFWEDDWIYDYTTGHTAQVLSGGPAVQYDVNGKFYYTSAQGDVTYVDYGVPGGNLTLTKMAAGHPSSVPWKLMFIDTPVENLIANYMLSDGSGGLGEGNLSALKTGGTILYTNGTAVKTQFQNLLSAYTNNIHEWYTSKNLTDAVIDGTSTFVSVDWINPVLVSYSDVLNGGLAWENPILMTPTDAANGATSFSMASRRTDWVSGSTPDTGIIPSITWRSGNQDMLFASTDEWTMFGNGIPYYPIKLKSNDYIVGWIQFPSGNIFCRDAKCSELKPVPPPVNMGGFTAYGMGASPSTGLQTILKIVHTSTGTTNTVTELSIVPNGEILSSVYGIVGNDLVYRTGNGGDTVTPERWYKYNLLTGVNTFLISTTQGAAMDMSIYSGFPSNGVNANKMMGSTYNYTTNVAEMFVIDITDGTTTTLSSPPGSWVLGINPVDISKYTYYDSTTYDTYYTDGIHTSNIGRIYDPATGLQMQWQWSPNGTSGTITTFDGTNGTGDIKYSASADFSNPVHIKTIVGYPSIIDIGNNKMLLTWYNQQAASMQALVMLSDGTLVSDVSWDGNNVGTILDGFGSPLKDGNNIVLFDYGAYKIKILDTTTWEIKSVIASSLPAMQVGYYAFIMDNVIQEIVASVVHGPYHGKKSYDAHVVTSIRADSSFKSSGSKNMTNSGSATQSLVPDLSKIEVRDSSKVSDWINSFTDKTASDVVEIGGLLFKSYN